MRLFVGLGNPGTKYQGNRHNIGFMVVDEIARRHGFSPWRRRFQGETSEGTLDGERLILLKPTTFMNNSGHAVRDAAQFFKLTEGDVVVFHDEIELPPAKVRGTTACGRFRRMSATTIAVSGSASAIPASRILCMRMC
jgi:PTH1 family peptidyl-tRNA hydrolase